MNKTEAAEMVAKIRKLMSEAHEAGDSLMVRLCEMALADDEEAVVECLETIEESAESR